MLHASIGLGRILAKWVASHAADDAALRAFALAVQMRSWSLHPKGSEARTMFRYFPSGVVHLLPGAAPPALMRAVYELGWAVERLTFAFHHPADVAELRNRDWAVSHLAGIVQSFRRHLGLQSSSHYLWYLEAEVPRLVAGLHLLGPFHGLLPQLGLFSTDVVESLNCRLKANFARFDLPSHFCCRYSSRGGGKYPGREGMVAQLLTRELLALGLEAEVLQPHALPPHLV